MLPPVPTFAPSISGPKPIVTAGMAPVAGGVTLLPLSSFHTPVPTPAIEPSVVTQGLVTATHIVPSVPASLITPPKLGFTPGLCVMNVISGTTVHETVCSVPTTEVWATTKQTQVITKPSPQQNYKAHLPHKLSRWEDQPPLQVVLQRHPLRRFNRQSVSAPVVSAPAVNTPIVVVKQPQPTCAYNGQTSWKQYKEYFTSLEMCNGWTTKVEKAQNLLVALEVAAAETVRELTAEKDSDYDAIWENLARRFGHIDEPE